MEKVHKRPGYIPGLRNASMNIRSFFSCSSVAFRSISTIFCIFSSLLICTVPLYLRMYVPCFNHATLSFLCKHFRNIRSLLVYSTNSFSGDFAWSRTCYNRPISRTHICLYLFYIRFKKLCDLALQRPCQLLQGVQSRRRASIHDIIYC